MNKNNNNSNNIKITLLYRIIIIINEAIQQQHPTVKNKTKSNYFQAFNNNVCEDKFEFENLRRNP